MRYFIELAYNGANYSGWQVQPNANSIQAELEKAFSTILNTPIALVGCGRTDASVHAKQYFAHIEYAGVFPEKFLARINKFLPTDIVIYRIFETKEDAHARFHATHRAYEYHLHYRKNPFAQQTEYYFPYPIRPDLDKMQAAAKLLLNYTEFFPFCKSNHDAKTMICQLYRAEWEVVDNQRLVFHISANRFLRGMVRLIVGMCVQVGLGKLDLEDVKYALDNQTRIEKSVSVPGSGLYLTDIRYPFIEPVE